MILHAPKPAQSFASGLHRRLTHAAMRALCQILLPVPPRPADAQGDISQARGQLGQLLFEFSQIELNRDILEAIRRTESKSGEGLQPAAPPVRCANNTARAHTHTWLPAAPPCVALQAAWASCPPLAWTAWRLSWLWPRPLACCRRR